MKKLQLRDLAVGFIFLVLIAGACKKKVPPPAPPPPPTPTAAAPSVTLAADPTSIQRGQSSTLRWSSQNATDLDIQPGVGSVGPSGTRSVSPNDSTTYTITAKGAGGTAEASARVTVTAPPPPPPRPEPPTPPAPKVSQRDLFDREVKDAFFDFDKSDIRPDARDNLTKSAEFLRANPSVNVTIEGHCDERGSVAYNLGLGDRRSNATKDFLVTLGISGERIKTISYGKERPFCTEHDETCWQQNRRGHLVCDNCGS
jgi:peptidoglycan-associated lipoprotein